MSVTNSDSATTSAVIFLCGHPACAECGSAQSTAPELASRRARVGHVASAQVLIKDCRCRSLRIPQAQQRSTSSPAIPSGKWADVPAQPLGAHPEGRIATSSLLIQHFQRPVVRFGDPTGATVVDSVTIRSSRFNTIQQQSQAIYPTFQTCPHLPAATQREGGRELALSQANEAVYRLVCLAS
jgi:hypothetical protein